MATKPSKTPKPNKTLSLTPTPTGTHLSFSYGPSLRKGTLTKTPKPHEQENDENNSGNPDYTLDEARFARVFEIAAIRVPSQDCAALKSRLRGHLLNWPRIRNITRVPGDDIDDTELTDLLMGPTRGDDNGDGGGELSYVLRRDDMARKFYSHGFVKFWNLARISRPKKKRMKREEVEVGGGWSGRSEFAVMEVVESGEERNVGELKGLLGEEFEKRGEWKGPTRLLLLDERCSTECLNEL